MPFHLPDGLIIFAKRDCPTCTMLAPVFAQLAQASAPLTIFSQDDPTFPDKIAHVQDDRQLETSFHAQIEIVPTIIKVENGREVGRLVGWQRAEWQQLTGIADLGADLPPHRPGCGSRSVEPGMPEKLALRFGNGRFQSRTIEIEPTLDPIEAGYERGWTDGLPVVPPTPARVLRMLAGTSAAADDVVGIIPPNNVPCTVEKVAVNAVMAGCKPDYLPVVLTAVRAACRDAFCMHGILATTYFSSPIIIVNGPISKAIGMNSGINVLGQGNRANATIGRALQLVIRNVGGGIPGGIDRATMGNPGKYSFCFAEDEAGSPWESLAAERGVAPGKSAVSLFAGDGVQPIMDQLSRTPESLVRTFAACLRTVTHPKLAVVTAAMLVISPEHARIFKEAGWQKATLKQAIQEQLQLPGSELVRGAGGIAEGMPARMADATLPKFLPEHFHIVHAGGTAGLFSAIISGWPATGETGSTMVTLELSD